MSANVPLDYGTAYLAARMRITELIHEANPVLVVPATPEWTVHDLVAHLCGVAEDATTGNMDGAPGESWTQAQVRRGSDKTVTELLQIWQQHAPNFEQMLSSARGLAPTQALMDVCSHECDLLNALGRPLTLPDDVAAFAHDRLATGWQRQTEAAGLLPLDVDIHPIEWFRSRLGRRTHDEAQAYSWSADPTSYLSMWFIFGPAARSLAERY